MSNNHKVKGLLRGLRFISQIFDNEKDQEIQIGNPTDVKHVAHIGWQGPSESSPSWMNEFKSVPGLSSSAPLDHHGEILSDGPDNSVKWVSQDSIRRASRSVNSHSHDHEKDMPVLPKSSRKHVIGNMRESHAKEKLDRPRQHRKSSKNSQPPKDATTSTCNDSEGSTANDDSADSVQLQGSGDLQPRNLPHNPRRSRSNKKTKDCSDGGSGSSKSRPRSHPRDRDLNSDQECHSRSSSRPRSKNSSFEEEQQVQQDGQIQRGSSKQLTTN